ncbi:hypothetical protein DFH11DRAFT_1725301 [Phellopilus nigrolimitatus]|nr:hypothetical protein DFH11DRAFT_1725301 [Phellopilus nigrolimitatus]
MPPPSQFPRQRPQIRAGHSTDSPSIDLAVLPADASKSHHNHDRLGPNDRVPPPRASPPVPSLHRNARSTTAVPTNSVVKSVDDTDNLLGLGSRATKLFAAMRRSSSYNYKRTRRTSERGMFSTPEERSASPSPAPTRAASASRPPIHAAQPPSIAQIAMGLHTSRTPHFGPAHASRLGNEQGGSRSTGRGRQQPSSPFAPTVSSSSTRAAQPLRSSMKKTRTDTSSSAHPSRSTSPSASASSVPATPRSAFSRISLAFSGPRRSRLDKLLGLGTKSSSTSVTSMNSSSDGELALRRKAVRFMSIVEDEIAVEHPANAP